MRITALVENSSACELKPIHGLSLYIETTNHRILFDLGPDDTLFENSRQRNIDLKLVDMVVISHGHADHGGALKAFLKINRIAKVYVQRRAFEKHYYKYLFLNMNVGLKANLMNHPQVVLVDGDYKIDDELELLTVEDRSQCYSNANDRLYTKEGKDDFSHEQYLLIHGENNVLVLGCGHKGIVNIMQGVKAHQPKFCIGGFHLFNPATKRTVPHELLCEISDHISRCETKFYTCHCTGSEAFNYLAKRMPNIAYLSCGETIEV